MKHYRIKVRDDKSEFFEELLRYLDFLDYEQVEAFSEPRIYTNFELKAQQDKRGTVSMPNYHQKNTPSAKRSSKKEPEESQAESLREVLARIDKMRDDARKNK